MALHGRVDAARPGDHASRRPSRPGLIDPRAGDAVLDVDGQTFRRGGKVVIRPGPDADVHARMLDGRTATIERIFTDYDGKAHLGLTIDDDPGQELMRETGRYLYFFAPELEVVDHERGRTAQHPDRRRGQQPGCATTASAARWPAGCRALELPAGVSVMDAGTGGLDLAYEVMRGYDALVILDVSRQGGEPGTLYVMEPDEEAVPGAIEDGDVINPHAMDPQTVLRFVKSVGAWPGRVVVIACEPEEVSEMGWGLSERVQGAVGRAVALVLETVEELRAGTVGRAAE